jgi:hypothetical protein
LSVVQKEKQGSEQGSLGWQQKLSRLGFYARGTPRWMKQKRVENLKAKFYERAEKFVETKEGCKRLTAKTGYVLAQKKSCQQFS